MSCELLTLVRKKPFRYDGSVSKGTIITYGSKWKKEFPPEFYKEMLAHFRGQEIPLGGDKVVSIRPDNSLGRWIADHDGKTTFAPYVAPILVHEEYCSYRLDGKACILTFLDRK